MPPPLVTRLLSAIPTWSATKRRRRKLNTERKAAREEAGTESPDNNVETNR